MNKLLKKPKLKITKSHNRYGKFDLSENPFPSEPTVNRESSDPRINGNIFEGKIRQKEYEKIRDNFLMISQSDLNHYRLGYIIDSSYIGRGNGKSAFLGYLQHLINSEFCLDISKEKNKCFAVSIYPEPGGRTKSFQSFIDSIFFSICNTGIIDICLATQRLEAIQNIYPNFEIKDKDNELLIKELNSDEWLKWEGLDFNKLRNYILESDYLQGFPSDFPLFKNRRMLFENWPSLSDFKQYYFDLKKTTDKLTFIFTHLVNFFQSANFNGGYILVDDFERIPDFQSTRQKKDFALELRSVLFDGFYESAKLGFFNCILVLHAGVPRLIAEAWLESGLEQRSPIGSHSDTAHIIPFEKLTKENALLLLGCYLAKFRLKSQAESVTYPFDEKSILKIAEYSEFNAAKILRMAYYILEKAASQEGLTKIDEKFIIENRADPMISGRESTSSIEDLDSIDLKKKAKIKE
ncbi:MAG: hypothetical protein OEZ13_08565 [Spirochaetia bacterium]|nr:hypothetical protein [Spirochaetia bacterium]